MDENQESVSSVAAESSIVLPKNLEDVLNRMDCLINELSGKQATLVEKIEELNNSVGNNESMDLVHRTMLKTHLYYKKLLQVRKDMVEVHTRSTKLKERAKNLVRSQELSALQRQQRKLAQAQKEQQLIAKPILRR